MIKVLSFCLGLIMTLLLSIAVDIFHIRRSLDSQQEQSVRFYHDMAAYQQLQWAQQKPVGPTATGLAK